MDWFSLHCMVYIIDGQIFAKDSDLDLYDKFRTRTPVDFQDLDPDIGPLHIERKVESIHE